MSSNAENLVRGMTMLTEDIDEKGNIKIRQSDPKMFEVGRNLAVTPGKVIFQNELIQLIQYAPSTETVLKTPLLIVPPWINKFYVLDLTPEKSYIKWCVDQGVTVFVISWVNPDAQLAQKGFAEYMREGPLAALDAIEQSTGEKEVHAAGYCVGGTLLAVTLAYMAAKQDTRIKSATFFATQVDFRHAGDLKVFVDEEQLAALEARMREQGYLEGTKMATAFNMLRSNDLIWPYVVNNYLRGKAPFPFDLLYWNSDATRMPAANHSFYLRNCYLNNALTKGKMTVADVDPRSEEGESAGLQSCDPRGSHRAGQVGIRRLEIFWRRRPVRRVGLGTHCRRGQSGVQGQVSILDRSEADRLGRRGMAEEGQGESRFVVAGLARMDQGSGRRTGAGARAGRRQADPDRGCAGQLREDEIVSLKRHGPRCETAASRTAVCFRQMRRRRLPSGISAHHIPDMTCVRLGYRAAPASRYI